LLRYYSTLAVFFIFIITIKTNAIQRLVLVEMQTSTENELNCFEADMTLNQLFQDYPDYFIPIVYHAGQYYPNDPFYCYNMSENTNRIYYYPPHGDGYYYTPYAWIDGVIRGGFEYNTWEYMTTSRYETDSPLEIDISGEFRESDKVGNLQIIIIAHELFNWQELKLRIALTEDSIYYEAPNNILWHNYTMRDIIPDTLGVQFNISINDTLEFNQSFSCPESLNFQFCRLVVWVQDDQTKEVLQTAVIDVIDMENPASVVETGLPVNIYLKQNYPNPFNAGTVINYVIDSERIVEIDIYNLAGQKINTLYKGSLSSGCYQAVWDGTNLNGDRVSSGIYFYRLTSGNNILTRRMLLLK